MAENSFTNLHEPSRLYLSRAAVLGDSGRTTLGDRRMATLQPLLKGMDFTRTGIARALARLDGGDAREIALHRWGAAGPGILTKAAAEGIGVGAATEWTSAAQSFVAAVREQSTPGRLMGLKRVPVRTAVLTSKDTTAAFVGEGQPIPVSTPDVDRSSVEPFKLAALVGVTREMLAATDPLAEQAIRSDLIAACTRTLDAAFLDPASGAVAGVRPASVSNGAPTSAATSNVPLSVRTLVANFQGDLMAAHFVAAPQTLAALNGLGFEDVGILGGELMGAPALASRGVPTGTLILLDPSAILYGEDPAAAEIDVSTEAALSFANAAQPADLTSLYQTDTAAMRATLRVGWRVARPGSVSVLTGIGA